MWSVSLCTLLAVVLPPTYAVWAGPWKVFADPDDARLTNVEVHKESGDIFVAGTNVIYQFGADFELKKRVSTGPVPDHPDCFHPSLPCEHKRTLTNYINYILLVLNDRNPPILLMCGNVYKGLCQIREIGNIERYSWVGPFNDSAGFVARKDSNFAFTVSSRNLTYIYTGSTHIPGEFSPAFLAKRTLWIEEEGQYNLRYAYEEKDDVTALYFTGDTKVRNFHNYWTMRNLHYHGRLDLEGQ